MLIGLGRVWSWWTGGWRSTRRARLQYAGMTIAFAVLAVVAAALGEPAVAIIAGVVSLICLALTVLAPLLASWARLGASREVHDGR
jgi:hypothetical protein